MLIDGGSAEAGEYAGSQTGRIPAADYLRRRNIRALNLLVSTHIHEDHVCGLLDAVSVAPPAEMWQALPENLWREMRHIDPAVAEDPSMGKCDPFRFDELPDVAAKIYHFAGLVYGDFDGALFSEAARHGKVAVDVQCLLRHADFQ